MNKYIKKYQKIVNEFVKKSFPELKDKQIKVIEVPRFFPFYSFAQKSFGGFIIFINKSQRKLELKAITGQLAHEFCHIILYHKNKSLLNDLAFNFIKFLSFVFNTNFSRKIETKIDRETIRRGYAKELAKCTFDIEKKFLKKELIYSRGYLSPAQIKAYAKKIGK